MDVSGQWCSLPCRSIRIGSYKVLPKERISVTEKGVQIRVPGIVNPSEVVVISIPMKDILKVLAHFGKSMPLLFLYVTPSVCQKARKLLKMTNSQSFYFDVQSQDDTQKRITILPEKLTEENKMILKQHFSGKVQELESKDANEILVRSSPKDIPMLKSKMLGGQPGGSGGDLFDGSRDRVPEGRKWRYSRDGGWNDPWRVAQGQPAGRKGAGGGIGRRKKNREADKQKEKESTETAPVLASLWVWSVCLV